jgi:hypothetical protein
MRLNHPSVGFILALALTLTGAVFGQGILTNDTFFVGTVNSVPGGRVMVPVYVRTAEYYQGWTIPFKFGIGTSPITCDSVSYAGTIMENWAWKSKFVNNNQWDNVQTCGATGLYVWAGDSMLPGYYLALKLYFTVAGTAVPQTIVIDTTTCSFAAGGQQNNFMVIVHTQSWRTRVVPGAIIIGAIGIDERDARGHGPELRIYPTVVERGGYVAVKTGGTGSIRRGVEIYDINGRLVDGYAWTTAGGAENIALYSTRKLTRGIYFMVAQNGDLMTAKAKLIVK